MHGVQGCVVVTTFGCQQVDDTVVPLVADIVKFAVSVVFGVEVLANLGARAP